MPMDMGKLVPEKFVVDLLRLVDLGRDVGHSVDLLDQLKTFGGCKLEQFSGMALEDHNGPAWEELIVVEIDLRQSEVCDEMVLSRPRSLARHACVRHG